MPFKIEGIEVAGFRAFNRTYRLPISGGLTMAYAPNAHGKSSFCEAIEWCLYGSTTRATRGDQLIGAREFDDSLRNKHYPKGDEAYVCLTLLGDGQRRLVRRVLLPTGSRLTVDGTEVPDLRSLGVPTDHRFSLILQHSIRDFIFSRPSERRRLMAAQIGLGRLAAFQEHLQNATNDYKKKRPARMALAREAVATLIERCTAMPSFSATKPFLAPKAFDRTALVAHLRPIVADLLGVEPGPLAAWSDALRQRRDLLIARAFDVAKLGSRLDRNAVAADADSALQETAADVRAHRAVMCDELAADEADHAKALLARQALVHAESDGVCPVCATELDAQGIAVVRSRSALADRTPAAEQHLNRWRDRVARACREVVGVAPHLLGEDDKERLRQLLADGDVIVAKYERRAAALDGCLSELRTRTDDWTSAVDAICREPRRPGTDHGPTIDRLATELDGLRTHARSCMEASGAIAGHYQSIDSAIRNVVADRQEVAAVELAADLVDAIPHFEVAAQDGHIEQRLDDLVKRAQQFVLSTTNAVLATKSTDLGQWFTGLHPDQRVSFKEMQATASAIKLIGQVFGEEVQVSALFSESQLNCLGLSYYAVLATSSENPFDFVVIDDPIQSMDVNHTETFKDVYLRRLLDLGKQVILLTHMQTLTLSLDVLYRHLAPLSLEFVAYEKDGPVIVETENFYKRMFDDIRHYRIGDSDRRRLAAARLRTCLERLVKDLYVAKNGSLPNKYRDADWTELKKLIPGCGLSPTKDEGRIYEAWGFCVKYPHDDQKVEPPDSQSLESQCDRIERIYKQYVLGST